MKLPLKLNRNIARLLMAAVLFTQWVLPASACAVAPAVPEQAAATHAAAGMPCHASLQAKSACIVHCSQADQASLDHAQVGAPPVSAVVWHVAVPLAPALASGVCRAAEPRLAAGPPLSILYCSLLN
jgi:hypothetical protein